LLKVKVYSLQFNSLLKAPSSIKTIYKIISKERPHIVSSWLYHSDLISVFMKIIKYKINIIWNVRNHKLSFKDSRLFTILVRKLLTYFSLRIPKVIIYNSFASKIEHENLGYCKKKGTVLHNFIDTSEFYWDKKKQSRYGKNEEIILGMAARYDKMKDHNNLLKALKIVLNNHKNIKSHLIGNGINRKNKQLIHNIRINGLKDKVELIEKSINMKDYYNSLDIKVLSSKSESFPNVIAESMACGIPCISTNVGDVEKIMANTGWIVPIGDSQKLAKAMTLSLNEFKNNPSKWEKRRKDCIEQIRNQFAIEKIIKKYNTIIEIK